MASLEQELCDFLAGMPAPPTKEKAEAVARAWADAKQTLRTLRIHGALFQEWANVMRGHEESLLRALVVATLNGRLRGARPGEGEDPQLSTLRARRDSHRRCTMRARFVTSTPRMRDRLCWLHGEAQRAGVAGDPLRTLRMVTDFYRERLGVIDCPESAKE